MSVPLRLGGGEGGGASRMVGTGMIMALTSALDRCAHAKEADCGCGKYYRSPWRAGLLFGFEGPGRMARRLLE
eukprot:1185825-Prorocentrum_minimum.AAC.1